MSCGACHFSGVTPVLNNGKVDFTVNAGPLNVHSMLKCLRVPVEKLKAKEIDSVKKRVTCLAWELGRVPASADVKAALADAFERHMGINLVPGGLTAEEEDMLISPTIITRRNLEELRDAGADKIGVAVDLATPELFDHYRGSGVGGPHSWNRYWQCLGESLDIFGKGMS